MCVCARVCVYMSAWLLLSLPAYVLKTARHDMGRVLSFNIQVGDKLHPAIYFCLDTLLLRKDSTGWEVRQSNQLRAGLEVFLTFFISRVARRKRRKKATMSTRNRSRMYKVPLLCGRDCLNLNTFRIC